MKKMMAGIMAIAMILSLGVHTVDAAEIAITAEHPDAAKATTQLQSVGAAEQYAAL